MRMHHSFWIETVALITSSNCVRSSGCPPQASSWRRIVAQHKLRPNLAGLFFGSDDPPFGRWCASQGGPCEFRAWAASGIRLAIQGTPRRPLPYPAGGRPQLGRPACSTLSASRVTWNNCLTATSPAARSRTTTRWPISCVMSATRSITALTRSKPARGRPAGPARWSSSRNRRRHSGHRRISSPSSRRWSVLPPCWQGRHSRPRS